MASKASWYGNALSRILQKNINLSSDSMKMMLLTGYTPNFTTNSVYSDISANEITGTGYTAGGVAAAGLSLTGPTAGNSWGTTWAANTAYSLGEVVKPLVSNTYVYRCSAA